MYPAEIVKPMREDLSLYVFQELFTAEEVNHAMNQEGTVLVVVNSVCGCAAANARPGAKMSLMNDKKPNHLTTVFAGVDFEAVDAARAAMVTFPQSSPSMALFKDGEFVHRLERHHIVCRSAGMVAANLRSAYDEFC